LRSPKKKEGKKKAVCEDNQKVGEKKEGFRGRDFSQKKSRQKIGAAAIITINGEKKQRRAE